MNQLTSLINNMSEAKGDLITYDEFKDQLMKSYGHLLSIKENDELFIVFSNNSNNFTNGSNTCDNMSSIEFNCKSIIFDKLTLTPIVSQYNNIMYNDNALKFLEGDNDWSKVIVQKCYEGTLIILFNNNGKWLTSTRRCLDAHTSVWIKGNSYGQMFMEAIEGKFTFDDLNPNYCYHFILVHHKNKNIVSYSNLGNDYKDIYHVLTTEKYSMNEVDYCINNVPQIPEEKFDNIDGVIESLNNHNYNDVTLHNITMEGYVLKYYNGPVHQSPFITLKMQTKLYETLTKYKPNNSNIYQCFLELYQVDKLNSLITFFIGRCNDNCGYVINCINGSVRNMAKELSNLYFMTRKKNNDGLYQLLPASYKKVLFGIHGIYLNNNSMPISAPTIYQYIKFGPNRDLVQLFSDRRELINNEKCTFINRSCSQTFNLTKRMFDEGKGYRILKREDNDD